MWAETEARDDKPRRRIPLDAEQNEGELLRPSQFDDGNLVVTGSTATGTPIVRYVPKGKGRYRAHFSSCPNAAQHRRK